MANVITVKLFAPVPYMRTPEALLPDKMKKSYALEQTWILGRGLVHAMEDNKVPIPAGKWLDEKGQPTPGETPSSMEYQLEVPMDLAEIEAFCKDKTKKIERGRSPYEARAMCLQQAMMVHTMPLAANEVTIEPLPEKIDPEDIVIDTSEIVDPEVIDVEWERDFVAGHQLKGYPVEVPFFGSGKIDKQIPAGPFTFYRVMADKPMPFEEFAQAIGASQTPLALEDWWKKVPGEGAGSATFPAMDPELREKLEAGEKVSPAEVLFKELFDRGCIDMDNRVICHSFPQKDVTVRKPKRDMAIQIREHHHEPGGWPSRIIKVGR